MTIPATWGPDDGALLKRLMSLAGAPLKSFEQVMAELVEREWIYTEGGGYGVTNKGRAEVLEDLEREETDLREAAQNFNSMSEDERTMLVAQATSFYFPNAPEEATQDEIDEVLMEVLQRLGVKHISIH